MTIWEHLTPEAIDWLIMAVAVIINVGLAAVVSNYLVDFKIGVKKQTAIFGWQVASTILYLLLVAVAKLGWIPLHSTLYPNPYDFLLVGIAPCFGALGLGAIIGVGLGAWLGDRDRVRIALGIGAVATDALIALLVILWLTHQT